MPEPDPRTCCLCGEAIEGDPHTPHQFQGHNPEPLASWPNRCCRACNDGAVIPERLKRISEQGHW